MGKPKEFVQRLLDELPDEASFEDIQYHIYVQEAVQLGLDAAARGELIDQTMSSGGWRSGLASEVD